MQSLPFDHIDRIKAQLNDELLTQLVAVLSKKETDDLLLVCMAEIEESKLPACCQAILIDELTNSKELRAYDGPIIAFTAVDVIRPEISTKGLNFYPLARILGERKLFQEMRQLRTALSVYLLTLWQDPTWQIEASELQKQRMISKLISFATAGLLSYIPVHDLVAVIPSQKLEAFIEEGACRVVYSRLPSMLLPPKVRAHSLQDLENSDFLGLQDRLVALEEFWPKAVQDDTSFPIKLRTALRKNGLDGELNQTIGYLAKFFYQRWENAPSNLSHLQTAFALAVEKWLTGIDVDDLVGVLPCNDFEEFLTKGAAIYLYRQLPEWEIENQGKNVQRSLFEAIINQSQLPKDYDRIAFSLLPLRSPLKHVGVQEWCDLGPVLHKAGQTQALARSAWLLTHDLINWPKEQRIAFRFSLTDLVNTIISACTLISLEDPWGWRYGRYGHNLLNAYVTLDRIFARKAQQTGERPDRLYYDALRIWYGCHQSDDKKLEVDLSNMVDILRIFEQTSRRQSNIREELREQAKHLQRLGTILLHMLSGGGQPEIIRDLYPELKPIVGSVPRVIHHAAAMETVGQIDLPSQLFRTAFQQYATIAEQVQQIRISHIPPEDKVNQLQNRLEKFEQSRKIIFALFHEARVLNLLYRRAIDQTQSWSEALQGSAQLTTRLQTHSVAHNENSRLTFLLMNTGRGEAKNVQVELVSSDRFRVIEESSVKQLKDIPSQAELNINFNIWPIVDDDFSIRLKLSYEDPHSGKQLQQPEFIVKVTSLDHDPFRIKPNPYFYGPPVQDYKLFYGRSLELETILNHLASHHSQSILLRGARRAGKTSILNMLIKIIEDRHSPHPIRTWFDISKDWYQGLDSLRPVPLDLQKLERPNNVLTATDFYRFVLERLKSSGIQTEEMDKLLPQPRITITEIENVLNKVVDQYQEIHLVLLIDEFDIVDLIEDKTFYTHLRQLISNLQKITWIISSALGLYKEVQDYESPFFNIFQIKELGRLDRKAAERLIRAPWKSRHKDNDRVGIKLQILDDAVNAILDETGSHPYFIQLLGSAIIEHVNSKRTNYVLHSTVYDAVEKILEPGSAFQGHFAYFWERVGGMGKLILLLLLISVEPLTGKKLRLAVHERLTQEQMTLSSTWLDSEYENNLARLQAIEAVTLDNSHRFVFGVNLFRRLLAKRSQRENLWHVALEELQTDFAREGENV